MKYSNLLKIINETSTAGGTCAANIATFIKSDFPVLRRPGYGEPPLGVGFDPNGHRGIYDDINEDINSVKGKWENLGIDFHMSENGEYITLSKIVVPEDNRNLGIGSKAMNILCSYADDNGKIIACTPDTTFGGKITKLRSFYKKFGFVENKGKNKDFKVKESYIRYPK